MFRRASTALFGSPIPAPADLPPDSVPLDVTFRRGTLIPRIGGILARGRGPAAAVTLGRTIILNPDATLTPQLLEHELAHVRQWRADPLFPVRYALATLRYGYYGNPYEVEAREASRARIAGERLP